MSKATFAEAMTAVLSERTYQHETSPGEEHPLPGWILLTLHAADAAWRTWAETESEAAALAELRRVAATAVASLEAYGAPRRELPPQPAETPTIPTSPTEPRFASKYEEGEFFLRDAHDEARLALVWSYVERWKARGLITADDYRALSETAEERRRQLKEDAAAVRPAPEAPDAIR